MSLSRRHLLQSASALGAMGLVGCSDTNKSPDIISANHRAVMETLDK